MASPPSAIPMAMPLSLSSVYTLANIPRPTESHSHFYHIYTTASKSGVSKVFQDKIILLLIMDAIS